MRARSRARTRLYAKYGRGFSEAATPLPRLPRHRREICIYQAGATNISFIICSERLICSPRRAASTCPPYRVSSSFTLSVRVEPRHTPFYPSLARRLKLIPNNACKSLGKCTSRVKTAPPSAGNGGHSIFVQRCFCADGEVTQSRKFALSAPALTIRDYQAGSFRRTTSRFCNARIVSTRWMFGLFFFFSPCNGSTLRCNILHSALGTNVAQSVLLYTRVLVYVVDVDNKLIREIYNNRLIRNINFVY